MQLSIVLSTHATRFENVALRGDLEANLARSAGWGYNGVELAIRDPRLVDAPELCSLLAKHRLVMPAIGTGQAWVEEHLSLTDTDSALRAAAIERIGLQVQLAGRLRASGVAPAEGGVAVILGLIRGRTPAGRTPAWALDCLADGLQECARAAEAAGARLALEPVNRYETDLINTVDEGVALIERVASPALGLLLDTFHMNIEEPSIEESVRRTAARIFHFHVADSNRWYPGAGHLGFGSILAALAKTGYAGFVSGEFLPRPDADRAAQLAIAHLRSLP
jgi:5-keto-L-gluconate epimerase